MFLFEGCILGNCIWYLWLSSDMEITKSLLFCSLYHGVLRTCFGTALRLFECSLHSCILSGPVDLLSSMLASLREIMVAPHSIFMHVHNLAQRFVNDCSFAEWDLLLSGDIHLKSPHGRCGHLWLVSPDYCPCHPSPQMCFHLAQACTLTPSGCSVQVNRVLTYHDLDKDLMKHAAFQTLVSGCCGGVTRVTPSPSRLPSSSTMILSCTKYTALSSKQVAICLQVCSSLRCGFHACLCL